MSPEPRRRSRISALQERLRRASAGDEGIGLILVLGYAVVITLIITVSFATVNSVTKSGTKHIQYGQAADSAEAGIDQTLARVQFSATYNSGVAIPPAWVDGFPDPATERTWVLDTAKTLLDATPSMLQKTAQGEYFAIRPSNVQSVYSIGWEPTRADAQRMRVLRNDYLFSSYNPTNAILTAGDISISGSFTLSQSPGTTATPNVHTEGSIVRCSASVTKPAGTKIGGVDGGCGEKNTSVEVPTVDPRRFYTDYASKFASQWYDLCAGGVMRAPGATPCSGSPLAGTRGWSYNAGNKTWSAGGGMQDGIYYVYQANANLTQSERNGGGDPHVTVVTESTNNLICGKTDGNIEVKQTTVVPAMPFVTLFSGGSIFLDSQSAAGTMANPGVVAAQENLDFQTSSANGVVGNVIGNNRCGGTNSFQGTEVRFDAGVALPFPDTIRSSLQTELF